MSEKKAVEENIDQVVGERIAMMMFRKKIKQTALGAQVGMNQTQLSRKLHGTRPWYGHELASIAAVLNVSVGELFGEATVTPNPKGPDDGPDGGTTDGEVLLPKLATVTSLRTSPAKLPDTVAA